jgi:DNA repair exonuclease SbcCD ATPase subunit
LKINGFKINGFGKLKNNNIELSNGINVIFGENESGKSSMLKFISAMFYGASKNKNGKEISDFDKFKPWKTEEFSGKINYTLDNGESFEVYREFKKKNPIIYNSNKEDISKTFKIDKTKGIEFFLEQTGIDEETFYSTAISEQEGLRLSKSSQASIIQKISNLISSGDDNISYKKSMDKINKMQNEEVGTERTSQRPINIVDSKINRLLQEKLGLESYKERAQDSLPERDRLYEEIQEDENKKEFLKEIKSKKDNNRLKSAEINFNKNLEKEYNEKIRELNKKISTHTESDIRNKKINFKNYYITLALLIILFLVLLIFLPKKELSALILIPILVTIYKMYESKKKIENIDLEKRDSTSKIASEIDILKQNQEIQRKEAEEKEYKLNKEIERDREDIISKYQNKVGIGYIEEYLDKTYEELVRKIELKENKINSSKFRLQTIENNIREINSKLENLSSIEEELQNAEEEKEELISLNNSYNIAKECLERAYSQVKENISPKFTENLCTIISEISNNRYKNIIVTDSEGLNVEIDDGRYIPASRLSVGTVDQMYLSLRLSALAEISNETMPIILDEAFAYFDNDRLTNILKYINKNFKNNQIIIFTCSEREQNVLDNLKIDYNLINLEK